MNSLIITLCVLITAETEILLATDSSTIMPQRNRIDEYSSSGVTLNKVAYAGAIEPIQPQPSAVPSMPLYNYNYNTDTGIQVEEWGYLNNAGTDQEALEVLGSYTYTDNEGNIFQVSYVANENGFQPTVIYLPTYHH